jgi:hypothetical protein
VKKDISYFNTVAGRRQVCRLAATFVVDDFKAFSKKNKKLKMRAEFRRFSLVPDFSASLFA